jgi:chromosome partitioning protein
VLHAQNNFTDITKRREFMRIIAVANQKGGCGKTTTAISLSSSLSLRGKKVLLVDCDPQAHATIGLNVSPSDLEKSIYHVLTPTNNGALGIEDVVQYVKENFDLAPSSVILSALEQDLSGTQGRENRLLEAIQALQATYDYVLIDCPPSVGLLCINALRACDEVIIPIDMSLFSLRGVAKLVEIILLIKDKLGHEIQPRALITMYDHRTRYSKQVLQKVKESFGSNVFESAIRYNIRLRETVDHGLPIGDYDKHAIGYADYENLAEEVIRVQEEGDSPEPLVAETARDILQNTEDYMDSVREALEEDLCIDDSRTATAYQCAPSSQDTGVDYTSNGPDRMSEDDR